ncbi:hypothetical protein [Oleiagrimonas soli]|uniref:Ribosomal protein L7/L12 n=1 Tax=Oleiagrimonas soli TaxID=1543381 RepID=A0A099CW67_9GAMM|nr:hypothetical protein [Oleiagrimonas soli]KGI77974.1 hypothetical protein LF63_0106195 [Oleiagrimonas soli]MBB6183647.1 ribosomal protein L7/L12 [Oleiagrimonas soli]
MDLGFDPKWLIVALPLIVAAWKWLRSHNDTTLAPPAAPTTDADIQRLVDEGRTIEAIKAIRQKYGYGLQQAKTHFDALQARRSPRPNTDPTVSPANDADIQRLVRDGRAIEAIKAIREKHHCSLQQAKAYYDALRATQGRT